MQKLNFPYPISLMIPVGTQVELSDPPKDGISSLSFGSDTDSSLLVSSWDSVIYIMQKSYV